MRPVLEKKVRILKLANIKVIKVWFANMTKPRVLKQIYLNVGSVTSC